MNKKTGQPAHIVDIAFNDALSERYYAYAMSTITARSLPDVRDGLKPVHRRLLYAMLKLKLAPESGFKKCARVVGDVIGKYHPHGDTAVYDTLVRLAQSFAVRYPLVEGQGNFGSIDGDNAAAMRYTEARLTPYAMALLKDIDKDTVDFRDTYDGEDSEPVVLPSAVPNLLANGSEGIAVGMATSVPPHNLEELIGALLHLLAHPDASIADLVQHVRAPDFPTGGIVQETEAAIIRMYETGKGSLRVRARWQREELERGAYQIVITEIPYQVSKSRLIEKIAELFKAKKLPLLSNIRDESAEEIRIVLEPKNRTIEADVLMESLFKSTELETRFNVNLNMLTEEGVPEVLSLKRCLMQYLKHRFVILERHSKHRLSIINSRLHILEGLLVAYLNLDEVIRIIRTEDKPKEVMMSRFGISDEQCEAILNIRLRALQKLEEIEIKREQDELEKERAELEGILGDKSKAKKVVIKEFEAVKKQFGKDTPLGARRTTIINEAVQAIEITAEAFIEKEPITVIITEKEWVKALKGHQKDVSDTKLKDGDAPSIVLQAKTTDYVMLLSSQGRFFAVLGDNLPRGSGTGEPLRLMIDLATDESIITAFVYEKNIKLLIASTSGKGCIVDSNNIFSTAKAGKNVFNPGKFHTTHSCRVADGDMVAVIGENRKLLIFELEEIPEINKGMGVILQRYKGAELADIKVFSRAEGLTWNLGKKTRTEAELTTWIGKRGAVGKFPPVGFPRNNKF
jgi:topoisomerase IV subunit A